MKSYLLVIVKFKKFAITVNTNTILKIFSQDTTSKISGHRYNLLVKSKS